MGHGPFKQAKASAILKRYFRHTEKLFGVGVDFVGPDSESLEMCWLHNPQSCTLSVQGCGVWCILQDTTQTHSRRHTVPHNTTHSRHHTIPHSTTDRTAAHSMQHLKAKHVFLSAQHMAAHNSATLQGEACPPVHTDCGNSVTRPPRPRSAWSPHAAAGRPPEAIPDRVPVPGLPDLPSNDLPLRPPEAVPDRVPVPGLPDLPSNDLPLRPPADRRRLYQTEYLSPVCLTSRLATSPLRPPADRRKLYQTEYLSPVCLTSRLTTSPFGRRRLYQTEYLSPVCLTSRLTTYPCGRRQTAGDCTRPNTCRWWRRSRPTRPSTLPTCSARTSSTCSATTSSHSQ